MSIKNSYQRKEERRQRAAERKEFRDKLSPKQQLRVLDKRLGKNIGAKKERTKLKALEDKSL